MTNQQDGRSPADAGSGSQASPAAPSGSAPSVSIPNAVRDVIAEANNSLYGSRAFFLSTVGGEPDQYHLARPIEALKSDARRSWRKAEIYEIALRTIVQFGYLDACHIDAARLAGEALSIASGIEAATADETALAGSAAGESPAAESRDAQGQSV